MKPDVVIARFGELTLKGRNRSRFEKRVLAQLQSLLANVPQLRFVPEFGRIYVELHGASAEPVAAALDKVFGLYSYSPAFVASLELEAIQEKAAAMFAALPQRPRTFKVAVRRANRAFPIDSQRMNELLGGYVLDHTPGLAVDVKSPETVLHVELRETRALLYTDVVEGTGGYPYGVSGKAMLMLSGGIDSPVAGWLAMRRGLEVEAVHFHSFPFTSERAKEKVADLARVLAQYSGGLKLHMVPFTELQTKVHEAYSGNLLVTVLRRAMLRITERLAEREKALAVVTGESLGQVASQTLPGLNASRRAVQLPILQPLIMTDKRDIIRMAQQIGTYPISILPYEDCCTLFVPPSPSTNPNMRVVEAIEHRMPWLPELIEQAAAGTETMTVTAQRQTDELAHLF
ncbi:thiamine biosynthesis protein ThiI [Gordoniibacillus kamchatkensis]|uniref:Probable tRNA sulfurtransferase n=1 Tax=Gordoniibacillus kamchatkensis TaxID=1590651 RepID=A0ABR5AL87_9BACL|nr:tRNA uracil 4-sulfurtransferase ThiI [Paenibacillus sp. VKM B-2647]KIL41721.1 thiamine biosynthesis protein ThiI [Paenibacillus sp. VKM B-2647]